MRDEISRQMVVFFHPSSLIPHPSKNLEIRTMAKHRVEDIRDIALVGHEQAGKTSLADALLFKAKAVDRKGSVDDGSSVSDYDDEEKKNKYSIDTSVLHFEAQGNKVNMFDAPGKPEFVGAAGG